VFAENVKLSFRHKNESEMFMPDDNRAAIRINDSGHLLFNDCHIQGPVAMDVENTHDLQVWRSSVISDIQNVSPKPLRRWFSGWKPRPADITTGLAVGVILLGVSAYFGLT